MVARDMIFRIVSGTVVPFRSTKEALIWARANGLIGRMAESETGGKGIVSISAESIREALNPRQREKSDSDRVHFAALGKLRDLIRESRILETHPDWPKGKDGRRGPNAEDGRREITICIAYAAFMFEDVAYRVRLTLKRYAQTGTSKAYAYRVNEIEVVSGTLGGKIALATNPTDTTSICADILLQGALDVNGEPLLRPYTDIAVIILIGQEKIHLKRCVEKLASLNPWQIFLVESQPDDGGVAIAKETAAKLGLRLETMYHKWPGTQAVQFNWALEQLEVKSKREKVKSADGKSSSWILRLDADEYLDEKGIEWLKANLASVPSDVDVLEFMLERKFIGGVIRHATNGIKMVRMFRAGCAKYAETLMDERLIYNGKKLEVPVVFWDDNLNGLEWWKQKHRGYAKREAEQAIAGTFQDPRKAKYYKLPRYLRAVMYFCIRYFLKGGFLDGIAGWRWNFWQGLWYRWLVDCEIGRRRDPRTPH